MLRLYRVVLERALNVPIVVIMVALGFAALSVGIFFGLPRELTPIEDRGSLFIQVTAPQGSTLAYTDETREIERRLAPLKERGVAYTIYAVTGQNAQAYRAFVVLRLAPWEARDEGLPEVMREVIPKVTGIPGVRGYPTAPVGLGLRGARTPLSAVISGPDFDSVKKWARQMLEVAEKDPRLRNVELDFEETQPQLSVVVRKRADDLGISRRPSPRRCRRLHHARSRLHRPRPRVQGDRRGACRRPDDAGRCRQHLRQGRGRQDAGAVVGTDLDEGGSGGASAQALQSAAVDHLMASLGEGYALGQRSVTSKGLPATSLPAEAKLGWSGQSQQFKEASRIIVTFVLALLIVFLVLAAQFGEFVHPL